MLLFRWSIIGPIVHALIPRPRLAVPFLFFSSLEFAHLNFPSFSRDRVLVAVVALLVVQVSITPCSPRRSFDGLPSLYESNLLNLLPFSRCLWRLGLR